MEKPGPALLHRTMPEVVVGDPLVPGSVDQALLPFIQQLRPQLFRNPDFAHLLNRFTHSSCGIINLSNLYQGVSHKAGFLFAFLSF